MIPEINLTGKAFWHDMLLHLGWSSLTKQGQAYINLNKITDFVLSIDGVEAKVPNPQSRPCQVKIELKHYTREVWNEVFNIMAEQAIFEAALLNHEMPSQLEPSLSSQQISLYPKESNEWTLKCSCQGGITCEHIAAVIYILGEKCKLNPLLIFELRGLAPNLLMKNIRQTRLMNHQAELNKIYSTTPNSADKPGKNSLHERKHKSNYTIPEKNAWLISSVQDPDFWKRDVSLDRVLSSVYQQVSQKAARIAAKDIHSIDEEIEP